MKLMASDYCIGLAKGRVAALDDLTTWIALYDRSKMPLPEAPNAKLCRPADSEAGAQDKESNGN